MALETTEREKEFYYAKLRDVEIFCQDEHIKDDPVRPPSSSRGGLQHANLMRPLSTPCLGLHMDLHTAGPDNVNESGGTC